MKYKSLFFSLSILFFNCFNVNAQGYEYGLNISPSYVSQIQRSTNTNTWSTQSGSGFLLGAFYNKKVGSHSFVGTALKFEYIAFNEKAGNFLVNSFRISSLNIPLNFKQEIGVTNHWFYNLGLGMNYFFLTRQFFSGVWLNSNESVNQWQPYIKAGTSYQLDSQFGLGFYARYRIVNLWNAATQLSTQSKSHLFSFDFTLRYTIASH